MTPLHFAAKNGALRACQAIVCSVPNPLTIVNLQDDGGWSPMVWSAEFGSLEILK
jgi:ankyrin repeat protein